MIMNMSAGANIQPVVGKLLSTLNVGDTLEVPVVSSCSARSKWIEIWAMPNCPPCLLYTSDAADE